MGVEGHPENLGVIRQRRWGSPPSPTGRHPGEGGTGWSREVKRVAWDFARDTLRQLSLAQRATLDAFSVSRLADSGTEGEAAATGKSSA